MCCLLPGLTDCYTEALCSYSPSSNHGSAPHTPLHLRALHCRNRPLVLSQACFVQCLPSSVTASLASREGLGALPFPQPFTRSQACTLQDSHPPVLQSLHPSPSILLHASPASCQTGPPCSLHSDWRMEKHSSRNSPDNFPPVLFFLPSSPSLICSHSKLFFFLLSF